jgi:hypothetical protein
MGLPGSKSELAVTGIVTPADWSHDRQIVIFIQLAMQRRPSSF